MTIATPDIAECTATECAYNHDGCHAHGITIDEQDKCATFFPTNADAGLPTVLATVGACQRTDCVNNENAMCTADHIRVGSGTDLANCLTFESS